MSPEEGTPTPHTRGKRSGVVGEHGSQASPRGHSQPSPRDAVDRARLRAARTAVGAVLGGGLWFVLGLEWIERLCTVEPCGSRPELLGLPVAWAAAAAVAGGRLGWRPNAGTRLAGLGLLVWTAFAILWPSLAALLLAGPLLDALVAIGFGGGFLAHWALVGGAHVLGGYGAERLGRLLATR